MRAFTHNLAFEFGSKLLGNARSDKDRVQLADLRGSFHENDPGDRFLAVMHGDRVRFAWKEPSFAMALSPFGSGEPDIPGSLW